MSNDVVDFINSENNDVTLSGAGTFEVDTKQFLGKGQYARVYFGMYEKNVKCAVKVCYITIERFVSNLLVNFEPMHLYNVIQSNYFIFHSGCLKKF